MHVRLGGKLTSPWSNKPKSNRERNELRAAAHAKEGEQELLLREVASTEHRLRSLQARALVLS